MSRTKSSKRSGNYSYSSYSYSYTGSRSRYRSGSGSRYGYGYGYGYGSGSGSGSGFGNIDPSKFMQGQAIECPPICTGMCQFRSIGLKCLEIDPVALLCSQLVKDACKKCNGKDCNCKTLQRMGSGSMNECYQWARDFGWCTGKGHVPTPPSSKISKSGYSSYSSSSGRRNTGRYANSKGAVNLPLGGGNNPSLGVPPNQGYRLGPPPGQVCAPYMWPASFLLPCNNKDDPNTGKINIPDYNTAWQKSAKETQNAGVGSNLSTDRNNNNAGNSSYASYHMEQKLNIKLPKNYPASDEFNKGDTKPTKESDTKFKQDHTVMLATLEGMLSTEYNYDTSGLTTHRGSTAYSGTTYGSGDTKKKTEDESSEKSSESDTSAAKEELSDEEDYTFYQQPQQGNVLNAALGMYPQTTQAMQAVYTELPPEWPPKPSPHLSSDPLDDEGLNFSFLPRSDFATEVTLTIEPKKKPMWQKMMTCGFRPMITCGAPPFTLPPGFDVERNEFLKFRAPGSDKSKQTSGYDYEGYTNSSDQSFSRRFSESWGTPSNIEETALNYCTMQPNNTPRFHGHGPSGCTRCRPMDPRQMPMQGCYPRGQKVNVNGKSFRCMPGNNQIHRMGGKQVQAQPPPGPRGKGPKSSPL